MTTSRSPGSTKLGLEHIAALSSLFGFQIWLVVMTLQNTYRRNKNMESKAK